MGRSNFRSNNNRFTKAKDWLKTNYPRLVSLLENNQFYVKNDLLYIKSNEKYSNARLVVPSKLIHSLLNFEHCINHVSHPGVQALARILCNKYYWPFLHRDCKDYVNQCHTCQIGKGHKNHKIGRLSPLHANHYGETVHMALFNR